MVRGVSRESSTITDARRLKYVVCPHASCDTVVHSNKFAHHMKSKHKENIENRGRGRGTTNANSLFICVTHPELAILNPTNIPKEDRTKTQVEFLNIHHGHVPHRYQLTEADRTKMKVAFKKEFGLKRSKKVSGKRIPIHSSNPMTSAHARALENHEVDLDKSSDDSGRVSPGMHITVEDGPTHAQSRRRRITSEDDAQHRMTDEPHHDVMLRAMEKIDD